MDESPHRVILHFAWSTSAVKVSSTLPPWWRRNRRISTSRHLLIQTDMPVESTLESLCRRDDILSSSSEVAAVPPQEREESTVGCEDWVATSMGWGRWAFIWRESGLAVGTFMSGAPRRVRGRDWLLSKIRAGEGALSLSQLVSAASPLLRVREPRVVEDRRQTA